MADLSDPVAGRADILNPIESVRVLGYVGRIGSSLLRRVCSLQPKYVSLSVSYARLCFGSEHGHSYSDPKAVGNFIMRAIISMNFSWGHS